MSKEQIIEAARLWMTDWNTADIAIALFVFESDVERHLKAIKTEAGLIKARAH